MPELQLNASFESWKLFWVRRNHPRFKLIAEKIFKRDNYTCYYCDFKTPKVNLEVINLDNNYQNNTPTNLATACPLCAQCFFLESIGTGEFGGGFLIYLPEISQAQLNALCNQSFLEIQKRTAQSEAAEGVLRDLRFRMSDVDKLFGDGMSDPSRFGSLMLIANFSQEKVRKILSPLRLLPVRSRFSHFIDLVIKAEKNDMDNHDFESEF